MSESNESFVSSSVVLSHSFGVLGRSGSGDIVLLSLLGLSSRYQGTGESRAEDVLELRAELVKSGTLWLVLLAS